MDDGRFSPRGTLALGKMSKAYAFLRDREYVVPRDVKNALMDVGVHRIRLNQKARLNGRTAPDILEETMRQIPDPKPGCSAVFLSGNAVFMAYSALCSGAGLCTAGVSETKNRG